MKKTNKKSGSIETELEISVWMHEVLTLKKKIPSSEHWKGLETMVSPLVMRTSRAQTVVLKFYSPIKESGLLGDTADSRWGDEMYMMSYTR